MTGVDEDFLRGAKSECGRRNDSGGLRIRPEVDDVQLVRWDRKGEGA